MASVSLDHVRKVFPNGQVAVADASLEIGDGELLVLVGPSGCGKSTLLRMIAGLDSVSSGTIRIGGRVVNDMPPKARDIAMVFQSYALYPHMSVAENLAFGLRLRGQSRELIGRRVAEAAALLGLEKLLDRRPRQLSGGQRQRVALGRALVRQPQVFLLDEPLSNLDARLRLTMRAEIARLHRRLNATMIYVTHDQVEAMTLGQRIVVLDAGEIQQVDTPLRIYQRPANLFVSTFLGSPPMNLFRGRWSPGPRPQLVGADVQLDVGGEPGIAAALDAGAELVVGLRPEHLQVTAPASAAGDRCRLPVVVEAVELLGNGAIVTGRWGAQEIVARMAPQSLPEPGERITLGYAPASLHYFRADSGERIG
jgi:multiple sugar transport system ATP-binding protein